MVDPTVPPQPMFVDAKATIGSTVSQSAKNRGSWRRRWWPVIGLMVVGLAVALAGASYVLAVYHPVQPSGQEVPLTIPAGATVDEISQLLTEKDLVRQPLMLSIYLKLSGKSHAIQAGEFRIPQSISIQDLVTRLGAASRDQVTLRFGEGWRREEMSEYIESQFQAGLLTAMTGQQFSDLALNPSPSLRQILGATLPADASLQGFLFPDTYIVDRDMTAEQLLAIMLDNYRRRATSDLQAGWQAQGLTAYQAVNLAAIVEREARAGDEERAIIAGILLKRLAMGIPLGVDATLQYALGYSATEQRWWKQGITVQDLELDSPYNTRKVAGLPPRPIANPGLDAMTAVSQPRQTDYLYYIHGLDGQVRYARNQAEHDANIARYLR